MDEAALSRLQRAPQLGHIDQAILADRNVGRPQHIGPHGEIIAGAIEELEAVILAIADDHILLRVERDAVRQVELARPGADIAPAVEQIALRIEVMDAALP
jgi:hypothetical protein